MYESAIRAAVRAARTWTPEVPDLVGGLDCCDLCLRRYRALVLNGPLQDLPHGVVHAAVSEIDDLLRARNASGAPAVGGLLVIALEELGVAAHCFKELRRRDIEPAIERYLARTREDGFPLPLG
ncbi:hypothetical protein [Amnibacterium setariae]|uniref:Uncharacterized protein n=1 Tax=Amnibacterium setariae TaxID=2306585 RepID=A0A3A1TYB5_9MICO|nr:hypothetical protein [Amnibacterium setariae]RIX28799.1 hypothetical protein D1781_15540 [Amnibacterium setariae]